MILKLVRRNYAVFRSSYPDVQIPRVSYPNFILQYVKEAKGTAAICAKTGRTLSYSELLQGCKSISSGLVRSGFKEKDVFCIFSNNCLEYPMAILGAMSAGGVVTTANPSYTTEELTFQLKDSQSKYLLVNKENYSKASLAAKASNCIRDIYVIDENIEGTKNFGHLLNDNGSADRQGELDDDPSNALAALLYSSGTTGLPKGVMLTHTNLVGNLMQSSVLTDLEEGTEVTTGVLPFYHVYGQVPVLAFTFMTKNKIVIYQKFDPVEFLEGIQKHRITAMHIVPPILLFLIHHPMVAKYDISSIKEIVCAAAPLKPETEVLFRKKYPNIGLTQGYGLTEVSPVVSYAEPKNRRKSGKAGNCGVLLPNQEVMIVDPESSKELGANERGEILIKGVNVMKGYLNNKKATDECIVNNWFHTGDIGYIDDDGYLFIVDRLKELIKVKGLQVAPAELEGLLLNHPGIQDAAVVGKQDDRSGEVPVAFVVLKQDYEENSDNIYNWISQKVAKHKNLDGGIIFTDTIPRAASGKILRRLLREKLKET